MIVRQRDYIDGLLASFREISVILYLCGNHTTLLLFLQSQQLLPDIKLLID
jgi:hypothetical protein